MMTAPPSEVRLPQSRIMHWIRPHPLLSFFLIAYAGAWIVLSIPVLSASGLGLYPIEIPPEPFYILSAIAGPTTASFLVARATGGKEGTRRLLRGILRWKTRARWYLLSLFGVVLAYLIVGIIWEGVEPWSRLLQDWPIFFTAYLPNTLVVFLLVSIWEEIGWSGYAAPALQRRFGGVAAAAIVGALWALWHLPTYFLDGQVVDVRIGLHDLERLPPLLLNLAALGVMVRIVMVWVSNRTEGSVIVLTLFHAGMNMTNGKLMPVFAPTFGEAWIFAAFGAAAAAIALLTRGRLSRPVD